MATTSEFSVGLAHKFCVTAAEAGWSPDDVNALSQDQTMCRRFLDVWRGDSRIVVILRVLDCSQPFIPAEFIGKNWNVWRGPLDGDGLSGEPDQDPRALTLATVDFAQAGFETCLVGEETSIKGEEKLLRLKQQADLIRLGGQQFQALWQDYQQNTEKSVLEWLRRTKGITYMDFMGKVLRFPSGGRCVLYLYWGGGRWFWRYRWLDGDWSGRNFSAVSPASISA